MGIIARQTGNQTHIFQVRIDLFAQPTSAKTIHIPPR